jgi:hypothetical protein
MYRSGVLPQSGGCIDIDLRFAFTDDTLPLSAFPASTFSRFYPVITESRKSAAG